MKIGITFALASIAVLAAGASALAQQAYPSKTIEMIVAQPPGGSNDIPARLVADKLQQRYGQTVAVVNRPGASGNVGAQYVVQAKPDGYTILFLGSSLVFNAAMKTAPFNFPADMTTIAKVADAPSILAINANTPAKTVAEFVKWTKDNKGTASYGSAGIGSGGHIFGAAFKYKTGADMIHVTFTGGPPAVNALLAGDIAMFIAPVPLVKPFIEGGQLRAIGVTSGQRLKDFPDAPTMAEAGIKDFEANQVFGFWGPKAMPADIVQKLNKDISEIVMEPDVRDKLAAVGFISSTESAAAFDKELQDSITYWGKLIVESGAKSE